MRKLFIAVLALAGASSLLSMPARVYAVDADEGIQVVDPPEGRSATRAARLRGSALPHPANDPDTIWIGHIYDATFNVGKPGATIGGAGPYHVGRGPNLPKRAGSPVTIGDNGTWDFDRFQAGETDSLQGWWPVTKGYQSTGGVDTPDYNRSFFSLDYGNQVNYVINQGSPKRTFGVVGVWHRDHGNLIGVIGAAGSVPTDSSGATVSAGAKNPWFASTQANPAPVTTYGPNIQPVLWSPTTLGGAGSTCSAWMGVRSHGDNTEKDLASNGGTGNPFSAEMFQYNGLNFNNGSAPSQANGTDHNFPGYGAQLDQILYRDVQLNAGDGLNLSFNYSTNMSTAANTTTATRCGWFDKDPVGAAASGTWDPNASPLGGLSPINDNNFISSSAAGGNAPVDSFMVYIGSPVNDANVKFSGTLIVGGLPVTTVYDKKRRWFSEVIRCVASDQHYKQLLSVAGNNLASFSVAIPSGDAALTNIKAASGNKVRIVFRVKTNRFGDDENGANTTSPYTSNTQGAAIIDNVVVGQGGWTAADGNFELASSIDNNTSTDPLTAWKSTGKPPSIYFHRRPLVGSYFNDPCGNQDDAARQCNMYGGVITPGDHDDAERQTGPFGGNQWERFKWFASPTVNLVATANGAYNGQGIDDENARPTGDYYLTYDQFNAGTVLGSTVTGSFFAVQFSSYPARQVNGNYGWGEACSSGSVFSSNPPRACFQALSQGAKASGMIKTTNAQQRPDSLRAYLVGFTRCYAAGISSVNCGSILGDNVGIYYDNFNVLMVDAPPPPNILVSIWMWYNDAFPIKNPPTLAQLVGDEFDTTGAELRNGLNNAPGTGGTRAAQSGDSVVVQAQGNNIRLDMIFRIKPGPANFLTKGVMGSGILKTPETHTVGNLAAAGDGSFFGTYMQHPGFFSTNAVVGVSAGGDPAGGPAMSGGWNIHTWCSARCDTAERNLFPTSANATAVNFVDGIYASMYHEGNPTGNLGGPDVDALRFKNTTFNPPRNLCVMPIPSGAATSANITCAGAAANWTNYTSPATLTSGWNGDVKTQEYKKIIPDGLLTPGSHIEYFFRRCDLAASSVFDMLPDTNFVLSESTDGHRWQELSVLPDRWKGPGYGANERDGVNPACMLMVDWADRRGDERIFVGIADSIGLSEGQYDGNGFPTGRWGAHNGWHARGDQDITVAISTDPTIAVYAHGGQPGSAWDMYGVKAAESSNNSVSFGSRSAVAGVGFMAGRDNKNGPSGNMLRQFYRILFCPVNTLDAGNIGPYSNKTDNDVGLLNDFVKDSNPGGYAAPRAVYFIGRNFMNGQIVSAAAGHAAWPPAFFGAGLVNDDYRFQTGNTKNFIDLIPTAPVVTTGAIYGVNNFCTITEDVLSTAGTFGAAMASKYEDTNSGNPHISGVYAPATAAGTHSHISLVDGWSMQSIGSRGSGSLSQAARTEGRTDYYAQLFKVSGLFGSLGCAGTSAGSPVGVGDNPNNALVYFLALRSENPFRSGAAKITFGIVRKEKVELKVYDVTGRLVKTLANREFEAGSHDLFWDGTADDGALVARGVYFYQVRTPSFVSQKKLAVLKN